MLYGLKYNWILLIIPYCVPFLQTQEEGFIKIWNEEQCIREVLLWLTSYKILLIQFQAGLLGVFFLLKEKLYEWCHSTVLNYDSLKLYGMWTKIIHLKMSDEQEKVKEIRQCIFIKQWLRLLGSCSGLKLDGGNRARFWLFFLACSFEYWKCYHTLLWSC